MKLNFTRVLITTPTFFFLVLELCCLIPAGESLATGESALRPKLKEYNERERERFESLLASGRPLSFPFSTGFMLSLVSSQHENWNVSLKGLEGIMRLSPGEIQRMYEVAVNSIRKDPKSNFGSSLYLLPYWKGELGESSRAGLNRLGVQSKTVEWDEENWNLTWALMNKDINRRTNSLLNEKLIPQNTAAGNPFRFTTQAVLTTAFHYRNEWKMPLIEVEEDSKGSNKAVKYMQAQGEFGFAETEEFSAVRMPLRGDEKSVIFILPKVDLTQFLKAGKERIVTTRRMKDGYEEEDSVPFPVKWEERDLSILIPTMRLTHYDQYGKNFPEFDMNQTFCTTLRDKEGKLPFFLRPIAQVNTIEVNKDFFEVASASGTAIEKFFFGLDLSGIGYPRNRSHSKKPQDPAPAAKVMNKPPEIEIEGQELISGRLEAEKIQFLEVVSKESEMMETTEREQDTTGKANYDFHQVIFNKPFLFYLHDAELGPLYYGIKDDFGPSPNFGSTTEENNNDAALNLITEEAARQALWSCKSFKNSVKLEK